jgi:TonB family protein
MSQPSMPGPEPSSPATTGEFRAQLDDFRFETDFNELAERFSALSGGGFSREISADLALEVVLNEIVERACGATGATGAAVVLWRDGEMVCRASSGHTAPDMGARLDTTTGISGACVRTLKTQRCDDVLADPRADIEASYRLGVRSVIVMPLMQGPRLLGLFELLSSRPRAFEERDELVMEALASRTLSNLERASKPLPPLLDSQLDASAAEAPAEVERKVRRRFDWVTWVLGAAVLASAAVLGILVTQHFALRANGTARSRSETPSAPAVATTRQDANPPAPASADKKVDAAGDVAPPAEATKPITSNSVPPGGLLVSQEGKEIFRMPPAQSGLAQGSGGQSASPGAAKNLVALTPEETEDSLLLRVEPDYPEQARLAGVQGAVVLAVRIRADGRVEDAQVVSGDPQLAQASVAAVKQWRFKPHSVGGHAVPMQTKVTLNFLLPHD